MIQEQIRREEDKLNLEAPELLALGDDEQQQQTAGQSNQHIANSQMAGLVESEVDETRRFTVKDFKEKAEQFVKKNFDNYAKKKKQATKQKN